MARRIHLSEIRLGKTHLSDAQARYLRDVLRLEVGDAIEVFGDAGIVGRGCVSDLGREGVAIEITEIEPAGPVVSRLAVAAAVPKAARADWMVEKLAELGVGEFFPMATERGVVLPKGDKKYERWGRLAAEASRQSGRDSVMKIHPLTTMGELLAAPTESVRWHLSTRDDAMGMLDLLASPPESLMLLVGPEGGWTDEETGFFASAGISGVRLTNTTLRVETAAVAAAAIAAVAQAGLTGGGAGATIGATASRKIL
jgi:16S rRNA (uracil1498-N3)-methyltransferase